MNRVYFGHHKCGSRFFRTLVFGPLAEAKGWDVVAYKIENPPFHFSHPADLDGKNFAYDKLAGPEPKIANFGNSTPQTLQAVAAVNPDFRAIRAIRDLRQLLVSNYFHHLKGHWLKSQTWVWDKLIHDRPILERLPLEEGLLYELDNLSGLVISDEVLGWPDDPRVLTVRLEDIERDHDAIAAKLCAHLEVEDLPPVPWYNKLGETGTGGWQTYFSPKVTTAFKDRYGDDLIRLGYAFDMNW